MRILFFHRWFGVRKGGHETHIRELASRLRRQGHAVDIVTLSGRKLEDLDDKIRIWNVSKTFGESLFSYDSRDPRLYFYTLAYMIKALCCLLLLKLRGIEYDVVSVHFVTEAIVMKIGKPFLRWPFVFVIEGYTDLQARIAKLADLRIGITKAVAEKCYSKCGYRPLVIPPGVDTGEFTRGNQGRSTSSIIKVLSVGRLVPEKNYPLLIETARKVCTKDPAFYFFIVGEGRERQKLEVLVQSSKLVDHVVLVGGVPDVQLKHLYASADLYLTTQLTETEFGIAVLEAMSAGLPVIAPSLTGSLEYIGDGGIVVPPRTTELANAVTKLGRDASLRERLAGLAMLRAKQYDWNEIVRRYERAYNAVIKSNRAADRIGFHS